MARSANSPAGRRPIALAVVVSFFFVGGWLDRSAEGRLGLIETKRLVVISDAGPVVVRAADTLTLTHQDSWLINPPELEIVEGDAETIVRTRCDGPFPCRSTLTLTVPSGTELVVVASSDGAHIETFDGLVTVFSSDDEGLVTLGPIRGTARVVATGGRVEGYGLELEELDVEVVDARVDLHFNENPVRLRVASGRGSTRISLPEGEHEIGVSTSQTVDIDVASVPGADSLVNVMSDGDVRIWTDEL
ncbi:MAG: hypothetical protein O3C27_00565 [Actinomycetota bacterium]|nr:hypothetical protein [Actinomycetota bacterium]